jgi:hypothetical protein
VWSFIVLLTDHPTAVSTSTGRRRKRRVVARVQGVRLRGVARKLVGDGLVKTLRVPILDTKTGLFTHRERHALGVNGHFHANGMGDFIDEQIIVVDRKRLFVAFECFGFAHATARELHAEWNTDSVARAFGCVIENLNEIIRAGPHKFRGHGLF